jgi:hypothetical protein
MSLKKSTLAAVAAISLVAVPTFAQAANQSPASKLSVRGTPAKVVRAGAAQTNANGIGGGSTIVALLAAIAVAVGIAVAAGGNNNPKSP